MSESKQSWQQWTAELEQSPELAAENAKLDFAVALERRMEHMGISRSELAQKLNTSPAAITNTLRGDANLSIERMVRLTHALDSTLHLHIAPRASRMHWMEVHDGNRSPVKQELVSHAKDWARHSMGGESGREKSTFAA